MTSSPQSRADRRPRPARRVARDARVARVVLLVVATLAAALVLLPAAHAIAVPEASPPPVDAATVPAPPAGEYEIAVVDWGYHTAIVLPQPAGWRLGPPGAEDAPLVEVAWGDRRWYRDGDFRPHAVFATLALPTEAVAYVAARTRIPDGAGPRATWRRTVDAPTLHALARELERWIVRDAGGARGARAPATPPVAGYRGRFYRAHGRYHLARNCNAWTVARLAAVGLARDARGVVLAGQVGPRLAGFARGRAAP